MAKQLVCQRYIFKLHSGRLRKSRWNLQLPMAEARRNNEIISLADSQVLRWIDELNGITDADSKAGYIKREIRRLKREANSIQNRKAVKELYTQLDELQFKPDYMCLIIDKDADYRRACKGFSINGIKYVRLLGTSGGIKNSTIVFVSERLEPELNRRINNGRNMDKPLVTAKLEAYRALACSASIPVSKPNGIIIVKDAETEFTSDIVYLTDENDGEPMMELKKDEPVRIDATDGFGLMLPSLAEKWSRDLGLSYVTCGVNTRISYEKGMVVTFDFLDFAEKVAGSYIVKDAWGVERDVRDAELILTTSMLKLWDYYDSCEDYLRNCEENKYTFCVTKCCPEELESERNLNYQFIQSYKLDDDEIEELIAPTMEEIKGVLGGDWRKTVLFLKGSGINDVNIHRADDDFVKAIMIDKNVLQDPYVQSNIYSLIRNRINEAKVGVLKVHANYSVICGDPYLLCQDMFGMKPTGLLSAGEIYNQYWSDNGTDSLACFRAPMTCHNNIRLVHPSKSKEAEYWYKHLTTCTVLNAWDTITAALNGCDFDGDIVLLTDNNILTRKLRQLPALMCVQRRAQKVIPTQEDFINSNIASFGNDIGRITNYITSMFEVQAGFKEGSREYEILDYRIRCGQLFQQNAIDRAKGIISKPMPKQWYDRHSANQIEDTADRNLYRSILAERKPYFMRYIYPSLSKQYNTYIKNTEKNALRLFHKTVEELLNAEADGSISDEQREYLRFYRIKMPVGLNNCVMNRICKRFETEFDGYISRRDESDKFDYRIMKSDAEYTKTQFRDIARLYDEYNQRLRNYTAFASYERVDDTDAIAEYSQMKREFEEGCFTVCQNAESLCDILLDICYTHSNTKRFVWDMCGSEIIHNLLKRNNYKIKYPVQCDTGEVKYCGLRYEIHETELGEDNEYCIE